MCVLVNVYTFVRNFIFYCLISIFLFRVCLGYRNYTCTKPNYCDDVEIDPRILGPSLNASQDQLCPNGFVDCFNFKCGLPLVPPSAQNGNAVKNAFPWHAFLQDSKSVKTGSLGYAGGGVLIDQYFVLTAAHKIMKLTSLNVILGIYNVSDLSNSQTSSVRSVYYHSSFNESVLKNDVALLQLEKPMNLTDSVNIICLPSKDKKTLKNYANVPGCIVTGFGQTSFTDYNAPTSIMKQVHVPIVDMNTKCVPSFTQILRNPLLYLDGEKEVCAGGQSDLDACTQDGGSPLVCPDSTTKMYSLVGLVLWGKMCGRPNVYGVYLNVSSYVDWISCSRNCMLGVTNCTSCNAKKLF